MVTLGFGFKSYVGYRMRQRRQKDIQKENETYYSLLREALPAGQAREDAFNPVPSSAQVGTVPDQERISVQGGGPDPPLPDKSASSRSPDKQVRLHYIVNNYMMLSQNLNYSNLCLISKI